MENSKKQANKRDTLRLKSFWRRLIEANHEWTVDDLSEEIGRTRSYLRNHLANDSVPGVDVIMGLSRELHLSYDYLMNPDGTRPLDFAGMADKISRQVSDMLAEKVGYSDNRPTGKNIMSWWQKNGGRLESFDRAHGYYDLFEPPRTYDRIIRPIELGGQSLATVHLGTRSPDLFHRTIDPLGDEFSHKILVSHQSSLEMGAFSVIDSLKAKHPETGDLIILDYVKTLAPVTLPDERKLILSYCELI